MTTVRQVQELFTNYDIHVKSVIGRKKEFFHRYQDLTTSLEKDKSDYNKARFKGLIDHYKSNGTKVLEGLKESGAEYNIFNVLKIKRKEAVTHTPFLTNLLNPKGSHSQGTLFIDEFIRTLLAKHPNYNNFKSFQVANLEVIDEKYVENGFIDIFIYSRQINNQFAIIIENKIDAPDQDRQLERYWDYARNQLRLPENQIALIYLNKRFKIPTAAGSINEELKWRLIEENKLICLSYQSNIYDLLSSISNNIRADNIKQIVSQYLKIIKKL